MIQNHPTVGRLILTSQRFAPKGRDADNTWPLFQTFALQDLFEFAVTQTFSYVMKSGRQRGYYYLHHDIPATDADFQLTLALRADGSFTGFPLTRGELFNAGIRGQLSFVEDQGVP